MEGSDHPERREVHALGLKPCEAGRLEDALDHVAPRGDEQDLQARAVLDARRSRARGSPGRPVHRHRDLVLRLELDGLPELLPHR